LVPLPRQGSWLVPLPRQGSRLVPLPRRGIAAGLNGPSGRSPRPTGRSDMVPRMTALPDALDETLHRVFGLREFRPQQREIIGDLMAGRDVFVLMPTGGGKSLCYQLPALLRPGLGLVISPLIALMKDQVDALVELGVRAAFYNS